MGEHGRLNFFQPLQRPWASVENDHRLKSADFGCACERHLAAPAEADQAEAIASDRGQRFQIRVPAIVSSATACQGSSSRILLRPSPCGLAFWVPPWRTNNRPQRT